MMKFEEFRQLAEEANLIPVVQRVLADLETPVSVLARFRDDENVFLLESVEAGERFGRYWFGSGTPSLLVRALQNNVDQLRELPAQDKLAVNSDTLTSSYEDSNDPLTLLYQSG